MQRLKSIRACALPLLALALLAACGSSSTPSVTPTHSPPSHSPSPKPIVVIDLRGTWILNSTVSAISHTQPPHILNENLTTGSWTGTSTDGATFVGLATDPTVTYQSTAGTYTASGTGLLVMLGTTWSVTGNLTDSNKKSGSFTLTRVSSP